MENKLELWNAVEQTPPEHTKAISGKSYSGTSPKPYYLIKKATDTFGPCGIGWGFTVTEERVEDGAGGERLHIARVKVWYKWNGERGEVEHIGGTPFSGTRASGKPFVDEDAPKKSVTDALVKALSLIGFAGDIFMGRYDDSKYVQSLKDDDGASADSKRYVKSEPEKVGAPKPLSKAAYAKCEQKMSELRTELAALDSYQQAEWIRNNPKKVDELRWLKNNTPDLYKEIEGLGIELD